MSHKLLVPIDLDHDAVLDSVLSAALNQAGISGAPVCLMTVVSNLEAGAYPYVNTDYIRKLVSEAQARLEKIGRDYLGDRCQWVAKTVTGSVASQIIHVADEEDIDLIVMASHDPRFSDIFFGSIADQVVRHAHHSVLIIRQSLSANRDPSSGEED